LPLLNPNKEPEKEEPQVTVEQVIAQKGDSFFGGMKKIAKRLSGIHAPPGMKQFGRTIWLGPQAKPKGNRWKEVRPYQWDWTMKKRRKR
jgi:hypothetical protein